AVTTGAGDGDGGAVSGAGGEGCVFAAGWRSAGDQLRLADSERGGGPTERGGLPGEPGTRGGAAELRVCAGAVFGSDYAAERRCGRADLGGGSELGCGECTGAGRTDLDLGRIATGGA